MTTQNVKLSELKAGDVVRLDGGFTCHPSGLVTLEADPKGKLYFWCSAQDQGYNDDICHYLEGQCDDNGYCIGVFAS